MRSMFALRLKKRILGILYVRRGSTLVELVVTFAVFGILMASSVSVVASGASMYRRLQSEANAATVADILMEKITGELAGASGGGTIRLGRLEDGDTVTDDGEGPVAGFQDREARRVFLAVQGIGADSAVSYGDMEGDKSGGAVAFCYLDSDTSEWVPWTFGPGVMRGFVADSLHFSYAAAGVRNVIRVELSLVNPENGASYTYTEYVKCYNVTA